MDGISLDEEIIFGFGLPAVGVDRRFKDDSDVSQVNLRLEMAWRSGWMFLFPNFCWNEVQVYMAESLI